jgi:hypothetical protein
MPVNKGIYMSLRYAHQLAFDSVPCAFGPKARFFQLSKFVFFSTNALTNSASQLQYG